MNIASRAPSAAQDESSGKPPSAWAVPLPTALGAGGAVILEALVCVAVAAKTVGPHYAKRLPRLPLADLLSPEVVPAALGGAAILWALLSAPLWTPGAIPPARGKGVRRPLLVHALAAALWQTAIYVFFLTWAARLTPSPFGAAAQSAVVAAVTAFVAVIIAERRPRFYPAAALLWAAIIPLCCYLTAEVFLYGPAGGGKTWSAATSVEKPPAVMFEPPAATEKASEKKAAARAAMLGRVVEYALTLSPGTAAVGALRGGVPGGAAWTAGSLLLFLCFAAVLCGPAFFTGRRRLPKDVSPSLPRSSGTAPPPGAGFSDRL